jgi:hypothetical protein
MTRIEKLELLKKDHFIGKSIEKLGPDDWLLLYHFLNNHLDDDYNRFEANVNRMWLSTSGYQKSVHWKHVGKILSNLSRTLPGFYGWYPGARPQWIHPLDRIKDETRK